jgi:hypothetical protein
VIQGESRRGWAPTIKLSLARLIAMELEAAQPWPPDVAS